MLRFACCLRGLSNLGKNQAVPKRYRGAAGSFAAAPARRGDRILQKQGVYARSRSGNMAIEGRAQWAFFPPAPGAGGRPGAVAMRRASGRGGH
ncbi:hypothetical protein [Chitiniphilus eburneus]|uniref:Uncharacterized protein n=1 Tax=Chitiniphilus eburneus TaxID=2571148 RepID=A0A4U0PBE2_9NEIS|nr:hypothetical protein [Chitiniphilus eburneus]TJZ65017.1 hypothetical protein FAZ21_18745 [Chitiniphilus eburneus]